MERNRYRFQRRELKPVSGQAAGFCDPAAFVVLGTCAVPKPRARGFASGLHYPLALALSLTRNFPQGGKKSVGKKWRLSRQQGSMAVLRAIGRAVFLAGVLMLPMLADSV